MAVHGRPSLQRYAAGQAFWFSFVLRKVGAGKD
jgi:hypothetical protein